MLLWSHGGPLKACFHDLALLLGLLLTSLPTCVANAVGNRSAIRGTGRLLSQRTAKSSCTGLFSAMRGHARSRTLALVNVPGTTATPRWASAKSARVKIPALHHGQ